MRRRKHVPLRAWKAYSVQTCWKVVGIKGFSMEPSKVFVWNKVECLLTKLDSFTLTLLYLSLVRFIHAGKALLKESISTQFEKLTTKFAVVARNIGKRWLINFLRKVSLRSQFDRKFRLIFKDNTRENSRRWEKSSEHDNETWKPKKFSPFLPRNRQAV